MHIAEVWYSSDSRVDLIKSNKINKYYLLKLISFKVVKMCVCALCVSLRALKIEITNDLILSYAIKMYLHFLDYKIVAFFKQMFNTLVYIHWVYYTVYYTGPVYLYIPVLQVYTGNHLYIDKFTIHQVA